MRRFLVALLFPLVAAAIILGLVLIVLGDKQNPIEFSNCAKPFIQGNRFPKVDDDTIAFWERNLFAKFLKAFIGGKVIPNIEHRWTRNPDEMSGLLNWMIDGLTRLLQNNTFTASKTTEQTKILFKRVSDTPQAFIEEQTERFPQSEVTRIDMYEAYKNYCEYHGLAPESERVLVAKLSQLIGVKTKNTTVNDKKTRVWIGRKLIPLPEEEPGKAGEKKPKKLQTKLPAVKTGTDRTDRTGIQIPQNSKAVKSVEVEIEKRSIETRVPSVLCVPESEPQAPQQPVVCVICQKPMPVPLYDYGFYNGQVADTKQKTKLKSRMFPFVTCTWNPITGCLHDCIYCWARELAETKLKETSRYKYGFKPAFHEEELKRKFQADDFVFVSDMGDAFGSWVNQDWQERVFLKIEENPETDFLLMTKNPMSYYWLQNLVPRNCVLGCTIESNAIYNRRSKAPWQPERLKTMQKLVDDPMLPNRRFIAIEPIMDFHLASFLDGLIKTKPWVVAVGYDNYNHKLPEPSLDKTMELIEALEKFTIVYRKTLRKAWWE